MISPVPPGTEVTYHGSLESMHGEAVIIAVSDQGHPSVKSDDGFRYTLATPGVPLYNVRRQSFTIVEDDDV